MKHLGDITKISGAEVPVVDVVIGGSPCQDLSIAGAGKGLGGSRSSLFFEQIRIIKEMRENDIRSGRSGVDVRPRYMVWENVPNALSINGGEDFRIVLEETARVADKTAVIPRPKKWSGGGCILADRWSIAWRIHDAQFWGVPQRRRRIALVADFGGQSAPEILFERKSVFWNFETLRETHETASERIGCSTSGTDKAMGFPLGFRPENVRLYNEKSTTICNGNRPGFCNGIISFNTGEVFCLQGNGIDRADTAGCNGKGWKEDVSYTLNTIDRHAVYDARGNGNGNIVPTITGDHENRVTDYTAISFVSQGVNDHNRPKSVRRLTPLEAERLQGFPDGYTDIGDWTDSKGKTRKTTDSARYKALGNSIALPFWRWMLTRLCDQYIRPASMASLFDGIGGFPYLWEQINGRGSCTWASEVDEFCIAVTERRINRTENIHI